MPIAKKIEHIFEPTCLSCGQTVLAMLSGLSVEQINSITKKKNELNINDMFGCLKYLDIKFNNKKCQAVNISDLPKLAILSIETEHCWHWSLYANGLIFDPEYGILPDFPPSNRKFYWEIYY